ncbi:MAG TPA: hypothetical protein VF755_21955 [Catenuloplanes sp.]
MRHGRGHVVVQLVGGGHIDLAGDGEIDDAVDDRVTFDLHQ